MSKTSGAACAEWPPRAALLPAPHALPLFTPVLPAIFAALSFADAKLGDAWFAGLQCAQYIGRRVSKGSESEQGEGATAVGGGARQVHMQAAARVAAAKSRKQEGRGVESTRLGQEGAARPSTGSRG